jgi:signal transduction histidine kinase
MALYFQYSYSKNILIQNFINKHYLDTLRIRESFKSLLDKAQYYFKSAKDENIKYLHLLPLFYSKSDFNVTQIAKILNSNSDLNFGHYEIFKINRNYIIEDGSYKPDIGYDLGQFKVYKKILDDVFEGKKEIDISPPHLDTSSMNLKRYYLILSPDKKYLLQLAFVIDMFKLASEMYNKIVSTTEDLKELKVYYVDNYLIYPINFRNRNQPKYPLTFLWEYTLTVLKKIIKISNHDVYSSKKNIKQQAVELSKIVDEIFSKHKGVIHFLDLKSKQLIFYAIINGIFEKSGSRLIIESIYNTSKLQKDIEYLRNRFLYIFLFVVIGIFLIYKLIISKISKEIKNIVLHMKQNKPLENTESFIEEIYQLKNMYNLYHFKINQEIEKNKKLLEENKRFIVDTVHQMKTPMSVIRLNFDYIKAMIDSNEIKDSIEEIDASISMLVNSYNDLYFLASHEYVEYKPQKINISEVLKKRIEFFNLIAKANNKKIIAKIDNNIIININPVEFERLVDNNIANAIKYSKGQDIIIELIKNKNYVILKFKSIGDKIKNPQKIFERNYREHSHKRGLGIGLNIVKSICKKYNIKYKAYFQEPYNVFEYIFSI